MTDAPATSSLRIAANPIWYPLTKNRLRELPAEVLTYLLGSRYCDTDRLTTEAWRLVRRNRQGSARPRDRPTPRSSLSPGYCYARATRTAYEAYEERVGVCRDFAHLAVALCRAAPNIMTRYCGGYPWVTSAVPPVDVAMDFHAWFEVYLGNSGMPPRSRHRIPHGRIAVAVRAATLLIPPPHYRFRLGAAHSL